MKNLFNYIFSILLYIFSFRYFYAFFNNDSVKGWRGYGETSGILLLVVASIVFLISTYLLVSTIIKSKKHIKEDKNQSEYKF